MSYTDRQSPVEILNALSEGKSFAYSAHEKKSVEQRCRNSLDHAIAAFVEKRDFIGLEDFINEPVRTTIAETLAETSILLDVPVPPLKLAKTTAEAMKMGSYVEGTSSIGFNPMLLMSIGIEFAENPQKSKDILRRMTAHEMYHFAVELAHPDIDIATLEANRLKGEAYENDPGEQQAREFAIHYVALKRIASNLPHAESAK